MPGARATDNLQRLEPLGVVWCPAGGGWSDVLVEVDATATVAQLRAALDGCTGDLQIDGRLWRASTLLATVPLRRGSQVAVPGTPRPTVAVEAVVELAVVAGVLAGRRFPLSPGSFVVGRSSDCDIILPAPSVSSRHAVIAVDRAGGVTVTDLASTNGCRVEGEFSEEATPLPPGALLHLGAVALAIGPARPAALVDGPQRADGTISFNRPPRAPLPAPPAPVRLPDAPREPAPRARLAWAAMVAPLALGIAMAAFYDPRFALFALFSPAMMLGTWAEDRRRARRDARQGQKKVSDDIAALRAQLQQVAAEQRSVLRAVLGDPAESVARIGSGRLWERRPGQPDFLQVSAGIGSIVWTPPVVEPPAGAAADIAAEVAAHGRLTHAPFGVDMSGGSVTGVSGPREPAVALLRSLVLQVAANHGPADVRVAVLTHAERAHDWDWVKWLPHSAGPFGTHAGRQIATTPEQIAEVIAQVCDPTDAVTVVVVDADGLTQGRDAPVRRLLGADECSCLVYAPTVSDLPALCGTVIAVDGEDGAARCTHPSGAPGCHDLLLAGVAADDARSAALAMAAIDDPELTQAAGQLPQRVSLLELLELRAPTADAVRGRWLSGAAPVVPVGIGEGGPLLLDLATDGPHGLIAGTTGAGKSELLRSIVAGLAATLSPDELTFVLIDYKGGSAFDVCAQLPHTVGMVTDLDEQLGSRALHCLEAELRHRERLLRAAGASDLDEYRARTAADELPPLPRLLVAVDEFATLVAELPDFIDRLVSIAQRGRSLGVHLLLATQRPAGAVSDNIRANTNLRIALRVQDPTDSTDVIGSPAAADLTRRLPGRGYVRLGPGEMIPFQAALVTSSAGVDGPPVTVRSFGPGPAAPVAAGPQTGEPTDLQLLVRAMQDAFLASGSPSPRRPWPEPLPTSLGLDELVALVPATAGVIGLADDPDRQRQVPFAFDLARGNLLLYGVTGSGPTGALAMIALALADRGDVDCYVVDAGSQALAPLVDLPHVGAVLGAGERERQERLVRMLADELAARRATVAATGALAAGTPTTLVLVDNYGAFTAAFDDVAGMPVLDAFRRIVADGPALGIITVASADRITAVPPATAATVAQRLVFRLSDRHDYGSFGLRPADVGDLPPNRAVDVTSGLHVQIAQPGSLAEAVASVAEGASVRRRPRAIGVLPDMVCLSDIVDAADLHGDEWLLPLGIGDTTLVPAGLRLRPSEHALITGPARSGKSSVLLAIATTIAKHRPDVRLAGVALRRSGLRDAPVLHDLATTEAELSDLIERLTDDEAPAVLVVDDADAVEDTDRGLAQLLAQRHDNVRVVGAGRADVLRTAYGHWTTELRRSRQGLALRPNIDLDGDLWHTPLPRRMRGGFPAGRGYLVADGAAELVQAAKP